MAKIDNLVLHGVGEAYLLSPDGKIATRLSKMQSMSIEVTSESEDVYGGDSLFPILNFIKSKSAQFKFKNAVFDMNVLAATQGVNLDENGDINVSETITVSNHSATLTHTSGVEVDSVLIINSVGMVMKRVSNPTGDTEFSVTESGSVKFADTFEDTTVEVSYICSSASAQAVNVLTDSVPGYVELRHTSKPITLPDGRTVRLHTRVYKAVCDGGFTLEYTRDGAVAPEVTFKSVDPQRTDKRFVSYSLEVVAA